MGEEKVKLEKITETVDQETKKIDRIKDEIGEMKITILNKKREIEQISGKLNTKRDTLKKFMEKGKELLEYTALIIVIVVPIAILYIAVSNEENAVIGQTQEE